MDAIKYLNAARRMCNHYANCTECPADDSISFCKMNITKCNAEEKVDIIEKWSKEHPVKTRQSMFLRQYPEAQVDDTGVLRMCPAIISTAHRGDKGGCADVSKMCATCRREFWMHEVE